MVNQNETLTERQPLRCDLVSNEILFSVLLDMEHDLCYSTCLVLFCLLTFQSTILVILKVEDNLPGLNQYQAENQVLA